MKNDRCIVLLSGGIDSTTTLYYAIYKGFSPVCLIFNYHQKHKKELICAKKIVSRLKLKYFVINIKIPWGGSSLIDKKIKIPLNRDLSKKVIPSTYVPARNIIFLSYAVSLCEVVNANYIFYGAHQLDYSGYPDCRKEFIIEFEKAINKGTKLGLSKNIKIIAPFINYSKKEIVELSIKLKVPLELTWSCYKGGKYPCRKCDACRYREAAFNELGLEDPLIK
ncbi:MAG: 7-cyano-7-deazaguanine synthase QueC [Endomicrobia bacterium]|nr:7-cyano-7-deazaguanine synthase QueC [Endomicrobiia bacterium]